MFVGHLAVGFLSKRAAPRVPLAFLIFCTAFLDVLWPVFVLAGIERARIVPGITAASPFEFVYYPWSHSVLAAAIWSVLAALPWLAGRRVREGLVVAGCVFSHVVLDSPWEAELARVLEDNPRVLSYAKNQGMQFEVPYRIGRVARHYTPDFVVRADVGGGEIVNLVLETKGYRGLDAQLKADAMRTLWIPGVNGLGAYGKWVFEEFREVFAIKEEFGQLVERLLVKEPA